MTEATVPEQSRDPTRDVDREVKFDDDEQLIAETFGTILCDESLSDEQITAKLLSELGHDTLRYLGRNDQPVALLRMVARSTGLLEPKNTATPITTTKHDQEIAKKYLAFVDELIKDAETKQRLLAESPRSVSAVAGDLFDIVEPQYSATNFMRGFGLTRAILTADNSLQPSVVYAQRLAMAMVTPRETIEAIAKGIATIP